MTLEQKLQRLGLDKNEVKVYLALLELGPSLISDISEKAGINRTTSYDILERLGINGLVVRASGERTKKEYAVNPPSRLITFLKGKQNVWTRRTNQAIKIVPVLQLLYKKAKKPTIKFFEGTAGVEAIYLETLKSKEEILSIADTHVLELPDLKVWHKEYARARARARIKERALVLKSQRAIKWIKNYPATLKYTEFKFVPKGEFSFSGTEIDIYEDKIMVAILKRPYRLGILITNQLLADTLKVMWELAWQKGEKCY